MSHPWIRRPPPPAAAAVVHPRGPARQAPRHPRSPQGCGRLRREQGAGCPGGVRPRRRDLPGDPGGGTGLPQRDRPAPRGGSLRVRLYAATFQGPGASRSVREDEPDIDHAMRKGHPCDVIAVSLSRRSSGRCEPTGSARTGLRRSRRRWGSTSATVGRTRKRRSRPPTATVVLPGRSRPSMATGTTILYHTERAIPRDRPGRAPCASP